MEDDVGVVSRLSWVNIIDVITFFFSAGLTEHINTWRLLGDCHYRQKSKTRRQRQTLLKEIHVRLTSSIINPFILFL